MVSQENDATGRQVATPEAPWTWRDEVPEVSLIEGDPYWDLTRPHKKKTPNGGFSKGNLRLFQKKSRLVKYYSIWNQT